VIAGAAAGAAAMVTPTRGAYAMLAAAPAFLIGGRRSEAIAYLAGAAVVPIGLVVYLLANQSFGAAFYDVVLFTLQRYSSIQSVPFGRGANPQNFPFECLFPFLALLALAISARDWRAFFRDGSLRTCLAFAVAGFAGCFPRPDLAHINFVTPLALPLLTACLTRLALPLRPIYRRVALGALFALFIVPTLVFGAESLIALQEEIFRAPRGSVALRKLPGASEMMTRIAASPMGDAYFFYPHMPLLPFLTSREHVSKHDLFTAGYTLPSQYREVCRSVMREAAWVVIERSGRIPSS